MSMAGQRRVKMVDATMTASGSVDDLGKSKASMAAVAKTASMPTFRVGPDLRRWPRGVMTRSLWATTLPLPTQLCMAATAAIRSLYWRSTRALVAVTTTMSWKATTVTILASTLTRADRRTRLTMSRFTPKVVTIGLTVAANVSANVVIGGGGNDILGVSRYRRSTAGMPDTATVTAAAAMTPSP